MGITQLRLDDLIERVRSRHPAALDRVAGAVETAGELSQLGDHLVGFFIDEARGAGESWAAIGERLGISRQAVQKRYAPQAGDADPKRLPTVYAKMVNDGKRVVVHAQEEARRRRAGFISTEHFLLGLADEPECVGARSLARCGAVPQVVAAAVNGRIGVPAGEPRTDALPFTPDGKAVLEHAARESVRLGHDYVGTGHLALGCLTVSGGLAAEVLGNLGVTYDELRAAVVELAPADPPLAVA
jgi:Clp amino terminal domain, pathogenicity island component